MNNFVFVDCEALLVWSDCAMKNIQKKNINKILKKSENILSVVINNFVHM